MWCSIEHTMYYESYITTTIYIMSWQYSPIWIVHSLHTLYIRLKVDHISKWLRLINDQMVLSNDQCLLLCPTNTVIMQFRSYEFGLIQPCIKKTIIYIHCLHLPKSGAIRLYVRNNLPYLCQQVHNICPIKNQKNRTHDIYQTHKKDIFMRLCTL